MRTAILFIGLFTGASAWAAESIRLNQNTFIQESPREEAEMASIPLYSKAQCLNVLPTLLAPEKTIASGLQALKDLNREKGPVACVEEALAGWEEIIPAPANETLNLLERLEVISRRTAEHAAEIRSQLECSPPGAEEHSRTLADCGGQWLSSAQVSALKNAQAAGNEAMEKAGNQEQLRAGARDFMLTQLSYAGLEPSLQVAAREMFDDPSAIGRAPISSLMEIGRVALCSTPAPEDAIKEACLRAGLGPGPKTSPDVRSKITTHLPALRAVASAFLKEAPERKRAATLARASHRRDIESAYGLRRLLTAYTHFTRTPGQTGGLDAFCEFNEAEQRQDLKYAGVMGAIMPLWSENRWKVFRDHGLSEREQTAVVNYSSVFYSTINEAIWKTKYAGGIKALPENYALYREVLNEALAKLPPYQGAVKRFSGLPKDVLADHQVGRTITYDAFTSTSRLANWDWTASDNHGFTIYGKHGKDISRLSVNSEEGEVLYPAGTRFKVISRKARADNPELFDFVLVEVDAEGKALADATTLPK